MNVLVLSGYGINCENETLHAFEVVGFKGKIVHINDLIQNPKQLNNYQVFSIPGGFSYGDDTGSGNAMAKKIMTNLYDQLTDFSLKDKLIIGKKKFNSRLIKIWQPLQMPMINLSFNEKSVS